MITVWLRIWYQYGTFQCGNRILLILPMYLTEYGELAHDSSHHSSKCRL